MDKTKMSWCISGVLSPSSPHACLNSRAPWHIQAQPQLPLSRGFAGCVLFLASSAEDWLLCSASELLIVTPLCPVQNVGEVSWHALGTVATLLAGTECTPLLSRTDPCVLFVVPES